MIRTRHVIAIGLAMAPGRRSLRSSQGRGQRQASRRLEARGDRGRQH